MKLYLIARGAVIALGVGVLAGCAGSPSSSEPAFDVSGRPQLLMPGAIRSDVKGLAMGAARSKGWNIVKSTDDRLVVQRPVDASSPAAAALGVAGSAVPPVIEVTSAFLERSDGVLVALGAELISQPVGEKAPTRVDYTETFGAELTQSLESLRAKWTANRSRVAGALPPLNVAQESQPANAEIATSPLSQAWANEVEAQPVTPGASTVATAPTPPAPTPAAPRPAPAAPEPRALPTPQAPQPIAAPMQIPRPTAAPTPIPRPLAPPPPVRTARGPAPVVDGTSAVATAPRAPTPSALPAVLPPVSSDPVSPSDNMLTLNQSNGTGTWAYYAEQYARLRGCNVADEGAQLIESRADGEVLKVACAGADSFLLKCQNGVCRALQ